MRHLALIVGISLILVSPIGHEARAKLNPLRLMTYEIPTSRAEVIIVLDDSKTMGEDISGGAGAGCRGPALAHENYDVDDDGMCTGGEDKGNNDCNGCGNDADKNIAGMCESCTNNPSNPSRMHILKRAMSIVLPEFRSLATFGIVSYPFHYGYYEYRPMDAASPSQGVTFFLRERELKDGGWVNPNAPTTADNGWDTANDAPASSFTAYGQQYVLTSEALSLGSFPNITVGWDSLYRSCSDFDSEGHCINYIYNRFNWSGNEYSFTDAANLNWEYVGSFYSFDQVATSSTYCRCPTFRGPQCDQSMDTNCLSDCELTSASGGGPCSAVGAAKWVYNKYLVGDKDPWDVISKNEKPINDPHYNTLWPQYVGNITDVTKTGLGTLVTEERTLSARMWVPLSDSTDSDVIDANLAEVFNRLATPSIGGITMNSQSNATAAGDGILLAHQHFYDRAFGQSPFSPPGDLLKDCRKRFVILLTDGSYSSSTRSDGDPPDTTDPADPAGLTEPLTEVADLYNDTNLSDPTAVTGYDPTTNAGFDIKTYVICVQSTGTGNPRACAQTADFGWDGVGDGVGSYWDASNESQLIDALRSILILALKGDFTTSSPGVTTVGGGSYGQHVEQNVVILPSAEYPDWMGHLRAVNMTEDPPVDLWDAGTELDSRTWCTRRIYTGFAESDAGDPVPLFDPTTCTIDTSTDPATCSCTLNTAEMTAAWPEWDSSGAPNTTILENMIAWLAGKDRSWKLSPVLLNVPATVGSPPRMTELAGHNTFEANYKMREELLFVTSNEGLHAFRTSDGSEAYMYIPPDALPGLYDLFKNRGLDPDPMEYKYVMARSPRVADIPDSSGSPVSWSTQLVVTMGPGGEHFTVLDITDPSTCDAAGNCTENEPPFTIVAHSKDDLGIDPGNHYVTSAQPTDMNVEQYMGESWSMPAIFYVDDSGLKAKASFSAGYPGGTDGDNAYNATGREDYKHYFNISDLWDSQTNPGTYLSSHDIYAANANASNAKVDYGVVANTVAVSDPSTALVAGVYQADLAGQIWRYQDNGDATPDPAWPIFNESINHPIYYAPAGYFRDTGVILLAYASGSFFEEHDWMNNVDNTPTSFRSKIFLRGEKAGMVDGTEALECFINNDGRSGQNICNCPGLTAPAGCTYPSERAKPVAQPVIVQSQEDPTEVKVFFTYYDPPPPDPNSCGGKIGTSWIFQINTRYLAGARTLENAVSYSGQFVSGLASVGGGTDVAVVKSGIGQGERATVETLSGESVGSAPPDPLMEVWREVR